MTDSITIRLPKSLEKDLASIAKQEKTSRSTIVRNALERYVAVKHFRQLRAQALPFAESKGILTDEDVFKLIS